VSEATNIPWSQRRGVAYVGLRPPGGPHAKLFGFLLLASIVLLMTAAFLPTLWVVGALGLVITGPVGIVQFVGRGIHQAPLIRRFEPYRELAAAEPGAVFRGRIEYNEDDHLGCVLYNSKAPVLGDVFFYRSSDPKHWGSMVAIAESNGLTLPRTLADDKLRNDLSRISLTADLLEPEHILKSQAMGSRGVVLMALVYLAPALLMATSNWRASLIYVAMAMGFTASLPRVRRLTRPYRWEQRAPVAGCGVLKGVDQRWTCDDALMIVQRTVFSGGIVVTLIGRAGIWVAGFADTTDDDFINLWQRWNHLDPKPELLE
jgi:hypothetical protein